MLRKPKRWQSQFRTWSHKQIVYVYAPLTQNHFTVWINFVRENAAVWNSRSMYLTVGTNSVPPKILPRRMRSSSCSSMCLLSNVDRGSFILYTVAESWLFKARNLAEFLHEQRAVVVYPLLFDQNQINAPFCWRDQRRKCVFSLRCPRFLCTNVEHKPIKIVYMGKEINSPTCHPLYCFGSENDL